MPLPNTIPEAVKLVRQTEADATADLSGLEESIGFVGHQMKKNAARSQLPRLRQELHEVVGPNAGAIFVSGTAEACRAFADIAEDDGPAITLDAREMYDVLAKVMSAGVRGDALFSHETLASFISGLRMLFEELGVQSIRAPDMQPYMGQKVPALADLAAIAQKALASVGVDGDLNALFLTHRAAEEAVKVEWSNRFLPVVVLNATPAEVDGSLFAALFGGRNVSVTANANPEPNDVVVAFNKLKATNKNRTRKQSTLDTKKEE